MSGAGIRLKFKQAVVQQNSRSAERDAAVVDLQDGDGDDDSARASTHSRAGTSDNRPTKEDSKKRPRVENTARAPKPARPPPPWRDDAAPSSAAALASAPLQRGGGAEAGSQPSPTARSFKIRIAAPPPLAEGGTSGTAQSAQATPRVVAPPVEPSAGPIGPSQAAATRKFVRHRVQPAEGQQQHGPGAAGHAPEGSASGGSSSLASVVTALRAENDSLREELLAAQEALYAEVQNGRAQASEFKSRSEEAWAALRQERWERKQERDANDTWRRDTQAALDSAHETASAASLRADGLHAQLEALREDPRALLKRLREALQLPSLGAAKLAELRDELDSARVLVADVQAKRAAEALKPLECIVCLDVSLQRVAFGCGHAVCARCEPRLSRCPICNAVVESRLRLYL